MDLSAIIDEFNRRKAQAGQRIGDMFTPPEKPANWFQQMQQGQNAVITPEQRSNVHKELADIAERMAAGMVPEPIRARERAMRTDPSAAAKPFTSEEVKGITPFVTAAAPIAFHGTPHVWNPPARTLDTLSEAIALSSPSGKMSQAARDAANERLSQMLFGKGGLQKTELVQPTHIEYMQKKASELRDLANRGMSPRKYAAEADRLDALVQAATKEAPDASKIGTGQGAQSYGHGLYFAENPEVAQSYLKEGRTPSKIVDFGGGKTGKVLGEPTPGSMYQVNIPDQHVARMLDWDKPLSEQAPEVQKAVNAALNTIGNQYPGGLEAASKSLPWLRGPREAMRGEDIYRALSGGTGTTEQASQKLAGLGIPGIKYLDQGSRPGMQVQQTGKTWAVSSKDSGEIVAGGFASKEAAQASKEFQGTRNFVVFDPAILEDVTRK